MSILNVTFPNMTLVGNMKMRRMLSICLKKFAMYPACDVPPLLDVCFGTSISIFC